MASKEGVKSPWKMTKQELLQEAQRLDCLVHPSWTAGEVRQAVIDKMQQRTGIDNTPKGLTQMTHAQLMDTAREMGLTLPVKPTKAQMIRAIRDSAGSPADTVVSFGRFRGRLFREVPESYLRWSITETEVNRDNALPDLIRLANYARMRLNAEAIPDPEEAAHVPYTPSPEDTKSASSEWSTVSARILENEFPRKSQGPAVAKAKGYPEAQKDMPFRPDPQAIARRRERESDQKLTPMKQDVPEEVQEEINQLMARLAALRDKHGM